MNWFLLSMLLFILERLWIALERGDAVPDAYQQKLGRCLAKMDDVSRVAARRGFGPFRLLAGDSDGVDAALLGPHPYAFFGAIVVIIAVFGTILFAVSRLP